MKIIELKQNTDEWLEFRKNKIGASDANIIMGRSRFKTRDELFKIKLGQSEKKEENTFIQQKGHKLEEEARVAAELTVGKKLKPIVVQHDTVDWLIASLDGYSSELNAVWEHKYVGYEKYLNHLEKEGKNSKVVEEYYPQIQTQLYITQAKRCILWLTTEKDGKKLHDYSDILPDSEYVYDTLMPTLVEFQASVNKADAAVDLAMKGIELESLAQKYFEYKNLKEVCEARAKEIESEIFEMVGNEKKTVAGDYSITQSVVAGKKVIDWAYYGEAKGLSTIELIDQGYWKEKKGYTTKRITQIKKGESK